MQDLKAEHMPNPLFTVDEVFTIEGRGTVICGFKADQYSQIKVGDALVLQRPDSTSLDTNVTAVYLVNCEWLENPGYGVLVDPTVTREDVPIGTKVCRNEQR